MLIHGIVLVLFHHGQEHDCISVSSLTRGAKILLRRITQSNSRDIFFSLLMVIKLAPQGKEVPYFSLIAFHCVPVPYGSKTCDQLIRKTSRGMVIVQKKSPMPSKSLSFGTLDLISWPSWVLS